MNPHKPLIAHIIFRLGTGGLENGVVNLINNLPADRFRHAVICMTDYTDFRKRITNDQVQVYCLNKKPGKDFSVYFRLWLLLMKIQPDILHTRNLSALEAQLPGFLAGVKHRVHSEHGRDIDDVDGINTRHLLLRRLFRPLVQRYIPMSKDLENWLLQQIKVPTNKITQIYNGVDLNRFKPEHKKSRELLPIGFRLPHLQVIGTVGRLDPLKDQATLIEAFIHLLNTTHGIKNKVRLVLVGAGAMQEELLKLVQEADLTPWVWFAGERSDVAELMATLDVFVLPSINEGISNTILEAMATGLPVIASKVGGNPELVVDNETGFLVPKQDPAAIAKAIKHYLDNPELMTTHGQAGRSRCEAMFSLQRMVANYERVYEQLMGN